MIARWVALQTMVSAGNLLFGSSEGVTKNPITGVVTNVGTTGALNAAANAINPAGGGGGGGGGGVSGLISTGVKAGYNYVSGLLAPGATTAAGTAATFAGAETMTAAGVSGMAGAEGLGLGAGAGAGAGAGLSAISATGAGAILAGVTALGIYGMNQLLPSGTTMAGEPANAFRDQPVPSIIAEQAILYGMGKANRDIQSEPTFPISIVPGLVDYVNQPYFWRENLRGSMWDQMVTPQFAAATTGIGNLINAWAASLGATDPRDQIRIDYNDAVQVVKWSPEINWGKIEPGSAAEAALIAQGKLTGFQFGGTIDETIFGRGVSGKRYLFGETGRETVAPEGAISELLAEVKGLRADLRKANDAIKQNTADLKYLRRWDGDGIPAERTI